MGGKVLKKTRLRPCHTPFVYVTAKVCILVPSQQYRLATIKKKKQHRVVLVGYSLCSRSWVEATPKPIRTHASDPRKHSRGVCLNKSINRHIHKQRRTGQYLFCRRELCKPFLYVLGNLARAPTHAWTRFAGGSSRKMGFRYPRAAVGADSRHLASQYLLTP